MNDKHAPPSSQSLIQFACKTIYAREAHVQKDAPAHFIATIIFKSMIIVGLLLLVAFVVCDTTALETLGR